MIQRLPEFPTPPSTVDDLIDRMRAKIIELDRQAAMVSNMRNPRQDNDFGRTAALMEEALNYLIWLHEPI